MKKIILFLLLGVFFAATAAENSSSETLRMDSQLTREGFDSAFRFENNQFLYDSIQAKANDKFRWARLKPTQNLMGDFQVRFAYTISFLHHFNGFELELRSLEKDSFGVTFRREQKQQGKHFVSVTVNRRGQKTIRKEIPYGAYIGALLLRREGKKLVLEAENSQGSLTTVLTLSDFPDAPASVAVKFTSPPKTHSRVQIREFSVTSKESPSGALYPMFAPVRKIADAHLVYESGTVQTPDGIRSIAPGGKVVFGIEGEGNMRNITLRFPAEGAIKVTAVQLDHNEPAINGEALLWDEIPPQPGLHERVIAPGSFLTRYPQPRKWEYPLVTLSAIFFVTVEPADGQTVRLGKMTLHASAMIPAEILAGRSSRSSFDSQGILNPAERGVAVSLGGKQLPLTSGDRFAGDFIASPHLLAGSDTAFSFAVNRTISAIDLIHAAGRQSKDDDAVPAAYQLVYEDGSTATNFVTLRWNSGVYHSDFLPRGNADYTWWGPVEFPRCEAISFPAGSYGELYCAVYKTRLLNPHPDRKVRMLTLYRMPGNSAEFLLLAARLRAPGETLLGTAEPREMALTPGRKVPTAFYAWSPDGLGLPSDKCPAFLQRGNQKVPVGNLSFTRNGNFSFASLNWDVPTEEKFAPGPGRLVAGGITTPLLGIMPAEKQSFHYSMICGPNESLADFERMHRLGFDTVKLVIPWSEATPGTVNFPNSDRYLKRIRTAGLQFSIRNHIRFKKGPDSFAERAVFQKRYEPGKSVEERPQIDPADPWTVERIVNLYRETARFARDNHAVSINANYGLRPETGLRHIDMGDASLAMFRKHLARQCSPEKIRAATGRDNATAETVEPLDLYHDKSGFLLKEYLMMHHKNLAAAQRAVMKAIRDENYKGHLVANVSFHPIEQKLIGANTGAYLALSKEFAPAALYHETSDRYSLSFVKYLASKRTFDLPYGDEGCLTPPPDRQNRIAYIWMATMQSFDSLCCQWFGGKPGMLNVAAIKPFHAMLYKAEYLPDDFMLALSLDSGFAEAPETVRSTLHGRTGSHYGLINTLRELNLNADRYWIDEFPKLDKNGRHKLMIDDISRSLSPQFADRIEQFIRNGGVFLASSETDMLNDFAFLKRFHIDPAQVPAGKVIRQTVGKGKLIFRNAKWDTGRWDPGLPEKKRQELFKLITESGEFSPNVKSDRATICVTPYRAENGDLLLQVVNTGSVPAQTQISWRKSLAPDGPVFDHASGEHLSAFTQNEYRCATVKVEPQNQTVIRMTRTTNQ